MVVDFFLSLLVVFAIARQNQVDPEVVTTFLKNAACNNMVFSVQPPQEKGLSSASLTYLKGKDYASKYLKIISLTQLYFCLQSFAPKHKIGKYKRYM